MEFKNANRNRNVGIPLFNDSNVSVRGNLAEVLKSGIKKRNSCVRFQKPITCADAQRVAIIEQRNANVTITICVFKFHRGPIKQNNHLHSRHRTSTCITLRTSSESNTRTLSFHMLYTCFFCDTSTNFLHIRSCVQAKRIEDHQTPCGHFTQ